MKSLTSSIRSLSLPALLAVGLVACGVGGDTGRLSLSLTDKPTHEYQAVYITIQEIAVHAADDPADSWTTVATPAKTINLLELRNGVREQLGMVDLATGQYTQMRLMIGANSYAGTNILGQPHPAYGNYVIDTEGVNHELKIPSGLQTGVKLVQGFEINENSTTELTLDFDAARSVVVAGKSGKYILKPTVHVFDTELAAVLSGIVTKQSDQTPLGGAEISVQVYDASLADPKDQVAEWRWTLTNDTSGAYKFFFAVPDAGITFNIVATKEGYVPASAQEFVENGQAYTNDFALAAVGDVGTVEITVDGASTDTGATLSFRQEATPGGPKIEVKSLNFMNGSYASDPTQYQVVLPVGEYSVVASTPGKTTLVLVLSVTKTPNAKLEVKFS